MIEQNMQIILEMIQHVVYQQLLNIYQRLIAFAINYGDQVAPISSIIIILRRYYVSKILNNNIKNINTINSNSIKLSNHSSNDNNNSSNNNNSNPSNTVKHISNCVQKIL